MSATTDDPDALIAQVTARPEDLALRERAARALDAAGRAFEAVDVLRPLANLTAHEGGPLPCLCRRCLVATTAAVEVDGQRFVRGWSVGHKRVLYYWLPEDLATDARRLARSVGSLLRQKKRGRA